MFTKDTLFKSKKCLICFEPILTSSLYMIVKESPICLSCMQKFRFIEKKFKIDDCPITVLYAYDDFFKTLLYQYKGLGDIALAPVFFHRHDVKIKYRDYVVVCVPSLEEDNRKRGFAPIETLANQFSKTVFTGLYKKDDFKQSHMQDRQWAYHHFGIKNGHCLNGKKVLILDDVYTSGTTFKACLTLVLKHHPQSVEGLILSISPNSKQNLKEQTYLDAFKAASKHFMNFVDEFFFKKMKEMAYTLSSHHRKE